MPDLSGEGGLLQFAVDLFYKGATDPSSALFLPRLIQGQTDPTYEPYVAGHWHPVSLPAESESAKLVCGAEGGANQSYIPSPAATPTISFDDVEIHGVSNILLARPLLAADVVSATASLSSYDTTVAPRPLTVTGNFTLTQWCCETVDFQTCARSSEEFVGRGTCAVKILSSSIGASVFLDGVANTATVRSLDFEASSKPENVETAVEITTVPEKGDREVWDKYAEKALNSEEAVAVFVQNVQSVLSAQSTLDSLSELLTQALRAIL